MGKDSSEDESVKRAKRIREMPFREFRPPATGEVVETEDGEGEVVYVEEWDDVSVLLSDEEINQIVTRMGSEFTKKYCRVTVHYPNNEAETYHIWEIDYDLSRRAEDHPWR